MTKQEITNQLTNLVNATAPDPAQKDALQYFFSRISEAQQLQIYFILLKHPGFLARLSYFIIQEKDALENKDKKKLIEIFTQEFGELENLTQES